jgi:hypothetical protein
LDTGLVTAISTSTLVRGTALDLEESSLWEQATRKNNRRTTPKFPDSRLIIKLFCVIKLSKAGFKYKEIENF